MAATSVETSSDGNNSSNNNSCVNTQCNWNASLTKPYSKAPGERWGHSMVNVYDKFLLVFGGSSQSDTYNDLWLYSPEGQNYEGGWYEVVLVAEQEGRPLELPLPRGGFTATVVGEYMYIIGGNNRHKSYNDMWRLSLLPIVQAYDTLIQSDQNSGFSQGQQLNVSVGSSSGGGGVGVWQCLYNNMSAVGGPEPCIGKNSIQNILYNLYSCYHYCMYIGHTVTAVGTSLVMYGGRDYHAAVFRQGVYMYDVTRHIWSKLTLESWTGDAGSQLSPRTGHCAVPCTTGIVYFGGLLPHLAVTDELLHLDLFGCYPTLSSSSGQSSRTSSSSTSDAGAEHAHNSGNGGGGIVSTFTSHLSQLAMSLPTHLFGLTSDPTTHTPSSHWADRPASSSSSSSTQSAALSYRVTELPLAPPPTH